MISKKGVSHVEVVLSFVIFIGFLIFLIAIFKPFKNTGGEDVSLDVLERKIIENTGVNFRFQTVNVSETPSPPGCFCFDYNSENPVLVKDINQNSVEAMKNGKLCIKSFKTFFYLSSSEEFIENGFTSPLPEDCTDLDEDGNKIPYVLGLFRSYKLTSYSKLNEIHDKSKNDYENEKNKLGIPDNKDYSFAVIETVSGKPNILDFTRTPPKGVRILARAVPIQIVYSNGEIKYAMLSLQIW